MIRKSIHLRLLVALTAFLLAIFLATSLRAEDLAATVVKVIDGDTIKVTLAGPMPELFRHQSVRLRGCDTPEKRDKRPDIAALARTATAFTAGLVHPGDGVLLRDIDFDKYGGRLLAHIEIDGQDLCKTLIEKELAKPYEGGHKEW